MLRQLFFIWMCFSTTLIFSQSLIDIHHYSVQNGLSQKNVQNFVQDDSGYIWMATWNGLERFDGYSFCNYKTYPESILRVANHRFMEIKKSSLNNIWCFSYDKHCYLFNTQAYTFEDPLYCHKTITNPIAKLYILEGGITWAVDMQNGVYRIDENKLSTGDAIEMYTEQCKNASIIYNIIQDREGNEWVLANSGSFIIGKESFTNLMPFEFMVETSESVYLATSKGLLVQYDEQSHNILPCVSEQLLGEIIGLKDLIDNKIAILHDNGITIYDPTDEKFVTYEVPIKLEPYVFQDTKGNIWFLGETGGVVLLDYINNKIELLHYPKSENAPLNKPCVFVHEDKFGCIWIKPVGGELCFYNISTSQLEQAYIYNMGIRTPIIFQGYNYFIDNHQNLWYTNGDGFGYITFTPKNFDFIINPDKKIARALMEDHQKRVWVGWKRKNRKQLSNICLYDSLGHWIGNISDNGKILVDTTVSFKADVYCIYEDRDHNIWLGTKENGLCLLRFEKDNRYQATWYVSNMDDPYSISSNSIYSILQDSSGRIWIGTYGGGVNLIEQHSEDVDLRFIHAGNILNTYPNYVCSEVRCLYETANKTILIGTTGGLLSCSSAFSRPELIRFYHNTCDERYSSLSTNDVLNIFQTSKGRLLVTTMSGGINVLNDADELSDKLTFRHYNANSGDVSDLTLATIEDAEGNIWGVSENKLSKFDVNMNLLEEYHEQIQMSDARPILCSSGKLVFGSMFGALCVAPSKAHRDNFIPPIVFTQLEIYLTDTSRRQDVYNSNIVQRLRANERNFAVTFAALDYVNPSAIKYAYRMKGLNDQWINIGNSRSASLANIPAGEYLFQVKSTNADGVWLNNITSLPIYVAPKFGETVWAVLLYVAMGIVILVVVIYIVIRITSLQRRVDFEQQLANLKLRFFTDISHELRTPLTLITGPIDEVINNEKLSCTSMENMQIAKRNTERMLRLVNQILDFRKIQNGKMKVLLEQVDVILLITRIYENFIPMAHTRHINLQMHCEPESLVIYTDVDKLEKILFNLLSNAFKYTPNERSIFLSVRNVGDTLHIQIRDEGRGIKSQKINQLFMRFETLDEIDPNISTGIGLSLVKELLELLHGSIKVDSKLGKGSLFSIELPGSYETFREDPNVELICHEGDGSDFERDEFNDFLEEKNKETRILIIEDNGEVRHFIYNVFVKDYVVYEAENGRKGLDITLEQMPDIIISDIMMPEMDGIEYLKKVKTNVNICHIPIILLSAKSSLIDQIQGLEYGADAYITKPFSSTYLKTKVDSLLKQRQMLYNYYTSKMRKEKEADALDQLQLSIPQVTHFDDEFIQEVLRKVEENIQNSAFKIDDLVDTMGMSRPVFYRKLKSLMGVSPVDFVKAMRIKRAVQLLEQGEYTVAEIGYMSGFTTPQYFSRVFKEVKGCTPKEYRSKNEILHKE